MNRPGENTHVRTQLQTQLQRIAAFSDDTCGGNPAGVQICESLPSATDMQQTAATVGYSETAFASPITDGYRVRYFSPQSEVPFCGHATIALGAALALREGNGVFKLTLNDAVISVEGECDDDIIRAALQSPPTRSRPAEAELLASALKLFNLGHADLDAALAPALIHAGADHLLLGLKHRETLANMAYNLAAGKALMDAYGLITIVLAWPESPRLFHTRNPFASGGVYEDPATGAATAALAGYLRDIDWPHQGSIDIIQGEDMGMRSLLHADIPAAPGSSIRVSGSARIMSSVQ